MHRSRIDKEINFNIKSVRYAENVYTNRNEFFPSVHQFKNDYVKSL